MVGRHLFSLKILFFVFLIFHEGIFCGYTSEVSHVELSKISLLSVEFSALTRAMHTVKI